MRGIRIERKSGKFDRNSTCMRKKKISTFRKKKRKDKKEREGESLQFVIKRGKSVVHKNRERKQEGNNGKKKNQKEKYRKRAVIDNAIQ